MPSAGEQPAAPPSAGELRARVRALLADPRFQSTVAAPAEPAEKPPPAPASDPAFELPFAAPGFASAVDGVAPLLFYVFLTVLLALVVLWIAQEVAMRWPRHQRRRETSAAPSGAVGPEGEEPLADALGLAAQGRHAEAVHALLLLAIRHLSTRSSAPPAPSRTSRELVRLLPLKGDSRLAFGELVAAVERSLFGGAPVAAADFERSLACFRTLVGELR